MPVMMTYSREPFGQSLTAPTILLASDSERLGSSIHRILEGNGFAVEYAGDYSALGPVLARRRFDVVLLEVTGEHAVESAVETALRVKRGSADQFVGYLADAELDASGLAGDAVFPRSTMKLPEILRNYFSEVENTNE